MRLPSLAQQPLASEVGLGVPQHPPEETVRCSAAGLLGEALVQQDDATCADDTLGAWSFSADSAAAEALEQQLLA